MISWPEDLYKLKPAAEQRHRQYGEGVSGPGAQSKYISNVTAERATAGFLGPLHKVKCNDDEPSQALVSATDLPARGRVRREEFR